MHGRNYGPPQDDPRHKKTTVSKTRPVSAQCKRALTFGLAAGFLSGVWLHSFMPTAVVLVVATGLALAVQLSTRRIRER